MCKVIGFRHSAYICPWCKENFGYNGCQPMQGIPASDNWHKHVEECHKKEYDKLLKKYQKEITIRGRKIKVPAFDITMDLMRGVLLDERKRRKTKELKESIKEKENELQDLKKELGDIKW